MDAVTRTTTGLLLREDFSSPVSWTGGANWQASADPGFVTFGATPLPALLPGAPGSADAGGVREATPLVEGSTWTVFYDAGDGTSSATGGAWKTQYATSTDGGLTWTRHGPVLPSGGLANGLGGTYPSVDMGYLEKRGSTYIYHALYAGSNVAAPGGDGLIPAPPYQTNLWTAPALAGPWTYQGLGISVGPAGSIDSANAYAECCYKDSAGIYHLYYGLSGSNYNNVSIATSTSPTGPFTKTGTLILTPLGAGAQNHQVENPKVWYWPALGTYCLTVNGVSSYGSGISDRNYVYFSNNPLSWSEPAAGIFAFQRACPADGLRAIGVVSPLYGPEAQPTIDPSGYVPVLYDGVPLTGGGQYNAVGRRLLWAVLEPSPSALHYNPPGGTDTPNRYQKSLAHGDFTAEWAVDYASTTGSAFGLGFDYRVQSSGDSYRVLLVPGSGLSLLKSTGGSGGAPGPYTTLASSTGTLVSIPNQAHRLQLSVQGNVHTLTLDGEVQVQYTDNASPYATGTAVALVGYGATARFRLLHVRTGGAVTVTGLQAGQTITFRAPGGVPVETATVTGTSYTTSGVTHYPIASFDLSGGGITPLLNLTIPGEGWGGDTLAVVDVSAPSSLGGGFNRSVFGAALFNGATAPPPLALAHAMTTVLMVTAPDPWTGDGSFATPAPPPTGQ